MSRGGDTDTVIVKIKDMVEKRRSPTQLRPTIYIVDERWRQVKPEDYEPKIVAIGPIHGKKEYLKMEEHKVRYLQQLLERRDDLSIDKLVKKLQLMEKDARQCYSKSVNLDADNFFLEMLVLDGCFLIELLRKYSNDSTKDDPVFKPETLSQIKHDLMLLENQLPFFVLNQLFDMTKPEGPDDNLCHLLINLVGDMFPWSNVLKLDPASNIEPEHLLGLVYKCFSPFLTNTTTTTEGEKGNNSHFQINSASELKENGIQLKQCKENNLTFENGVLKFPSLQVSGDTEFLLRNLMAYEQLSLGDDHQLHVTDYAFFMHCLIRSTRDIEILRQKGIICNYLGGDGNIYLMFDGLGKNFLRSSEFRYSGVLKRLNSHCGRRYNKWMANLRRNYFNSPWSMIKFGAASALLLLTLAQTVVSILSYRHRNDVLRVSLT